MCIISEDEQTVYFVIRSIIKSQSFRSAYINTRHHKILDKKLVLALKDLKRNSQQRDGCKIILNAIRKNEKRDLFM